VRQILNGMVTKLSAAPDMKFIYAEISFFDKWWSESEPKAKAAVKKLFSIHVHRQNNRF
jgi:hypothetical protein